MDGLVAADAYFDFEAAAEDDLSNELEQSTTSTQPIEYEGQRPATPEPSQVLAPLPFTDMQQQWPVLAPVSQNMGTGHFTYRKSTASY